MSRFLGIIALLGAVGAANQVAVNILFPANWEPKGVAASVVDVEKAQTTFALGCPSKAADRCSVFFETMTQGPSTWVYNGEWETIAGVDQYTLNNNCKLNTAQDKMTCTMGVTQVKDDETLSTVMISTTTGLLDYVYPIPITAGAGKLSGAHPKPTKTEPSTTDKTEVPTTDTTEHATADKTEPSKAKHTTCIHKHHHTSEEGSTESSKAKVKPDPSQLLVTSSDFVVVARPSSKSTESAEPTTILTPTPTPTETSSTHTPTVVPTSTPDNAAVAGPTRNAMLVGAAAMMGGLLVL